MYIKEVAIGQVLLWQDRKPYSQEEMAVGIRKQGGLDQGLSGSREDLSCLPGEGLLEAGDEHQEIVLLPVTPRLMASPLCPPGPEKLPSLEHRDSPRHRGPASARPKMLVISGGDGYEDFRLSSGGGGSSETVGRDDSTNHLLLWRV